MKNYNLMMALLIGVSVIFLSGSTEPLEDLAWKALLNNIEYYRSVYEEGVFVLDMSKGKPQPLFYELGRKPLNKWLEGIRAFGVRFNKNNRLIVQEAYILKFPPETWQIKSGEDKGNFTNSNGDLIVPGVRYFLDLTKRSIALEKIDSIEKHFENEVKEIAYVLSETDKFMAKVQGLSLQAAIEIAINTKKYAAVQGLLQNMYQDLCNMKNIDMDIPIDIAEILSKCLQLPSPGIRRWAAMCACHVKDKRLFIELVKLLNDKAPKVRYWAVAALVKQGDKKVVPKIKQMAKSDSALPVRQLCLLAYHYIEQGIEF